MKGVSEDCECIELCPAFQNHTTVISSMEIHANNCSPHKLNHGKTDAGEGPKSCIHPCEHHSIPLLFFLMKSRECFHFPSLNIHVPVISFTHSPSSTGNKDASHYGKHLSLFKFYVKWASMYKTLLLLSSLTVHCRLSCYWAHWQCIVAIGWSSWSPVGWQHSSWLRFTQGSRRSKCTEGVARHIATRRSRLSQVCEEVPHYSLQN